jgi:hypothetical protein
MSIATICSINLLYCPYAAIKKKQFFMRFSFKFLIPFSAVFLCLPAFADACPKGSSTTNSTTYNSGYVVFNGQRIDCIFGGDSYATCGPRITLNSSYEAVVQSNEGNFYKFHGSGLTELPRKSLNCSSGTFCLQSTTQTVSATNEYSNTRLLITSTLTWKYNCSRVTF